MILNSLFKMGTVSKVKHDQQGPMVAVMGKDRSMMMRMQHEQEMVMKDSGECCGVEVARWSGEWAKVSK